MKIGKLPNTLLEKIVINPIMNNNFKHKEVVLNPSVGEDCSVVDLAGEMCVLSTDPITGTSENIGKLAVNINLNDIASNGAVSVGIMVTALFPPNITEDKIADIMKDIYNEAEKLNIAVLGGHTEITDAVVRPVISCTAIGKTKNRNFTSSGGAEAGQGVIMTKWAGIEGTCIIASDFESFLKGKLDDRIIQNSKSLEKYLSVVKEAEVSASFGATCMHDITEGGVLGGCWEIAQCSDKGIEIDCDKIPVLDETKKICDVFNINPLRLISSGSLLITAFEADKLALELNKNNINAAVIGKITDKGKYIVQNGVKEALCEPHTDELYKVKDKFVN